MKLPIILVIDDDAQVLRALMRDLRTRFREEYRVVGTEAAHEALEALKEFKLKGEEVALFLSDQRMPNLSGVDFLEQAKEIFPEAKRVLLTAYSDTDAAIKAINDVQLDYYLMKPWDPPEEKLYPVLTDLLDEWQANYKPLYKGIKIVGYTYSAQSHNLKDFLAGNLVPYQWLDLESNPEAAAQLQLANLDTKSVPAVFFEDGTYLVNPKTIELAARIGLNSQAQGSLYDVAIIGAGPSGLAAAVYAGSEGLRALLIEKHAPGGQAGTSSRIENYLGFPKGLSGAELSRRAITQATRFGIEFLSPQEVTSIRTQDNYKILTLGDGSEINARSIIITTGVDYRKLEAKGVSDFTGSGIYYGAASTEAVACRNKDIYVVGGGNSAGQAAMYLSNFARKVHILIRKKDLSSTMSQYLIDQIAGTPNIEVVPETEIAEAKGHERLECLVLTDLKGQNARTVEAGALFIFIGAKPVTEWLELSIIKNDKGFIETGRDLIGYDHYKKVWKLDREPFLLETCSPGIFAAGDVRAGAMNRVASAVGEGAMAVKFVHEYLAEV